MTLSEETDKKILKKLEDYYDALIDIDKTILEQELAKQPPSAQTLHTAGIGIQLNNGKNVYANINPGLLNRVLQNISLDELNAIVSAITRVIEKPDNSRLVSASG